MGEERTVPAVLRAVAILFLISGLLALLKMAAGPFQSGPGFTLNIGVLGIPICFGLLALRNGWRVCALVFVWLGITILLVISFGGLLGTELVNVEMFGNKVDEWPGWAVPLVTVPLFLLMLWQYRVLTRPDIRKLFLAESGPTTVGDGGVEA